MTNFKKYEIELPAIDDTCKDENCGHKHKVEVTNKPEQPIVREIGDLISPSTPPPAETHNHIRTDHKELAELLPRGTNYATCADGSCGNETIKNSKITKKFKTCDNCNSNGVPKKSKLCPTCGIKESNDDAENIWSDSDIDADKIDEADE